MYSFGTPQFPENFVVDTKVGNTGLDTGAGRTPTGVWRQPQTQGANPSMTDGGQNVAFRPNPFTGTGTLMSGSGVGGATTTGTNIATTSIAVTKLGGTGVEPPKPTPISPPAPLQVTPTAPPQPTVPMTTEPASSFWARYKTWIIVGASLAAVGGVVLAVRWRKG